MTNLSITEIKGNFTMKIRTKIQKQNIIYEYRSAGKKEGKEVWGAGSWSHLRVELETPHV